MMDDLAVFTDFVRNALRVNNQQKIYVITNFVESFGYLIAVNDVNIETFVKYTYSTNYNRAAEQRILVRNNVTQGLKSIFFKLTYR